MSWTEPITRLWRKETSREEREVTEQRAAKPNGFDLEELQGAANMLQERPTAGRVVFRSRHEWERKFAVNGHAEEIEQAGQVIRRSYSFRDDYPAELMGTDSGPAPVENLMAALGACVASTYASQAAVRGIEIEELTVDLEAELDLRGMFKLAPIRPGLSGVRAKVRVKSDADDGVLEELGRLTAQASPVYDSVSNPIPIKSSVEATR